jgi:hypothetical protein
MITFVICEVAKYCPDFSGGGPMLIMGVVRMGLASGDTSVMKARLSKG